MFTCVYGERISS